MNTNHCWIRSRKQNGFLLLAALGFIIAFSLLVFIVTQKYTAASNVQLLSMLSVQADNAANSGVEEGVYQMVKNTQGAQYCKTMSLQRQLSSLGLKTCSINISCNMTLDEERSDNILYLISSQAHCGSDSTYVVRIAEVGLLPLQKDNDSEQYRIIYRKIK